MPASSWDHSRVVQHGGADESRLLKKGVALMLRRIMMLVAAAALMVALSATTVSTAFADAGGRGYGSDPSYKWCGNPNKCDESWGYACGAVRNGNKDAAYSC